MSRRKVFKHPVLLTGHVFDKLRSIDLGLAEFEQLLGAGELIDEHAVEVSQVKELVLILDWPRPLHVKEALMRCERCDNGDRRPARRARLTERDGRTAVVLDVPVELCDACGETWLTVEVAKRLDGMFDQLLASGAESSQRHWDQPAAA